MCNKVYGRKSIYRKKPPHEARKCQGAKPYEAPHAWPMAVWRKSVTNAHKKRKSHAPMAKWRQRGCDSEVVLVVLSLIMLVEQWCRSESEKIAEKQVLLVWPLRPKIIIPHVLNP